MHRAILSAAVGAGFALAASAFLLWLALRYVPYQAGLMVVLDAQVVPLSTRWVMATSNWVVRLLPIAVILSVPLGVVATVGLLAGASRWGAVTMARAVLYVSLVAGITAAGASAGTVIAIHQAMADSLPEADLSEKAWEIMWPQRSLECAEDPP